MQRRLSGSSEVHVAQFTGQFLSVGRSVPRHPWPASFMASLQVVDGINDRSGGRVDDSSRCCFRVHPSSPKRWLLSSLEENTPAAAFKSCFVGHPVMGMAMASSPALSTW